MNLSIPSWAQVTNSSPGGTGVVIRISTCLATGVDVVVVVVAVGDVVVVFEQAVIAGIDTDIMSKTTIDNNTDFFILCV